MIKMFNEDPTYYNGEKKEIFKNMIGIESSEFLQEVLKFEDVIINGYEKSFPEKIAFKWQSVVETKEIEGK
jgi:hypothetical protein